MTTYTVTINVASNWVTDFNENSQNPTKLIMAKAVADGSDGDTYNVVASTSIIGTENALSWTDNYQMSGSAQTFQQGVTITSLSGLENMSFQDTYYLNGWSDYSTAHDPGAPSNGFGFKNKIVASAVITLDIQGQFQPAYITPYELPPGTAYFTPLPKVAFWFQSDLSTGTMVAVDTSEVVEVDLSSNQNVTITYNADGTWTNNTLSGSNAAKKAILYTGKKAVKPAKT